MAEASDADWTCAACQAHNSAVATACAQCGATRGSRTRYAATLALPSIGDAVLPAPQRSTPASGEMPRRARADMATMQVEIPAAVVSSEVHPTLLDAPAARSTGTRRRLIPEATARAIPLAVLVAIGAAVLTAHAIEVVRGAAAAEAAAALPALAPDASTLVLPPVTAVIGLSEDNKEAVLSACWRISANPTHECQPSYLRDLGEYPAREVAFPALRVDRYEVSNAAWQQCVDQGACPALQRELCRFYTIHRYELGVAVPNALFGENRPAVCVSWDEAAGYCAARGMRLPTNDEWERIARSGVDRMYPWGTFWLPALLNWGERDMLGFPIAGRLDGAELTAAVDEYGDGRTDDGVLNVLGNVAEWVQPHPDDREEHASVRGGSYTDDVTAMRITTRFERPRSERRSNVGFRCVADVAPEATGP